MVRAVAELVIPRLFAGIYALLSKEGFMESCRSQPDFEVDVSKHRLPEKHGPYVWGREIGGEERLVPGRPFACFESEVHWQSVL